MKVLFWCAAIVFILSAVYVVSIAALENGSTQFSATPEGVTFSISDVPIQLQNGEARAKTALGGSEETIIRYFGNDAVQDLDGDGVDDRVFLITQEVSGSAYFYLVGALKRAEGYVGTHAVLVGENISPQTTGKGEGRSVVVNYAEQRGGESFGKSLYLLLDTQTLNFGELVQDFEGESR